MFDLESQVRNWRDQLQRKGNILDDDLEELESHLRDQIDDLGRTGLDQDEAFLIAVKRMGNGDMLSSEFGKVNAERLWRQLVAASLGTAASPESRREVILVILLSAAAGLLARLPLLVGIDPLNGGDLSYWKVAGYYVLPAIAAYFMAKRRTGAGLIAATALIYAAGLAAALFYPFTQNGSTVILTSVFLPVMLWFVIGVPYGGSGWRSSSRRMDYIRFTGETFIYSVLLYCGGIILIAIANMVFMSIGLNFSMQIIQNVGIVGAFSAPIVASYLAESKKSVVENIAPVLARIFSPLFLILLTVFVATMAFTGKSPFVDRDYLLGFEGLLVLVLAMVLYVISARPLSDTATAFDYVNAALITVALIVDVIVLAAVVYRSAQGGVTPNRAMVIGTNILFLIHYGGIILRHGVFFRGRKGYESIERWMTGFFPVYAAWAAAVALVFPVLYAFD